MHAAFDSRAGKDSRGVGRYARSLLSALIASGRGGVIESHAPRRNQVDVYHSPWLDGALLHPPVPMVVTVHDLVSLTTTGELMRRGPRVRMLYLAVQRAVSVIVPSEVVADDVMRSLQIPSERIHVIPEAAARVFYPRPAAELERVRSRYSLPEDYLLWVGGLTTPDTHKRVVPLIKARRSLPLVLAGPSGPWARTLPDVILTGAVPDDDLAAIYTAARALVYPSTDEGFGLAPVEALACGTPVVASDIPTLRETLGERAQLLPPDDLDALVRAAEAATRPAPAPLSWSWEDAADSTWDVLESAVSAPSARICHSGASETRVRRRVREQTTGVR